MEKTIDESKQGTSVSIEAKKDNSRKLYLESYGCALVNTCSIRDKAEQTVRKRLEKFNAIKKERPHLKVGVLGCMAERLKSKFLEEEKIVDMVVGPDAYKDLPNLIQEIDDGKNAVNVILSKEETYGDITPVRLHTNGVNAFVSITRGCDNMCTFCVVPFTRGRERSREPQSILKEVADLWWGVTKRF